MCDPTAVFIMQAASTAVNMSAQNRAANDAAQAQQRQHELEQQRKALETTSDLILKDQQAAQESDKREQIWKDKQIEKGQVFTAAASSGGRGTGTALLSSLNRQELEYQQILTLDAEMRKQSSFLKQQSDQLRSQTTHESIGSESIYGANMLSGALDIGTAYSQMRIDQGRLERRKNRKAQS